MNIFIIFLIISSNSFASCIESKSMSNIVVAGGSITEIIYFLKAEKNLIDAPIRAVIHIHTSTPGPP